MNKKFVAAFLILMIIASSLILLVMNLYKDGKFDNIFKTKESESLPVIEETFASTTPVTELDTSVSFNTIADAMNYVAAYANENNINISAYPQPLYSLLVNNPDSVEFVLEYPLHVSPEYVTYETSEETYDISIEADESEATDVTTEITEVTTGETTEETTATNVIVSLEGEISTARINTLYQWDSRWGYNTYANSRMCFTGSAPTCVSLVAMYLLHNPSFTPAWIAEYSMNNGYCSENCDGTDESALISDGGFGLGIDVTEITIDEDRIKRNLDCPNPIICDVGDHYIILLSYDEENFTVIDPTSEVDTSRTWTWTELQGRLRRLWVYRIM